MKVIIIGAGIGGLSTYHSLTKHLSPLCDSLTLKVYESHGPPEADAGAQGIGGALGLAPNGLRAISSLSPEAIAYIEARAYPGSTFTLRNSAGKLLCNLHIRKERYGFDQLMVRRSVVHEALLIGLPPDAITWNKAVESVKETEEGVEILFKDGSRETADLVIGADGAWSQVRSSLFGEQYKPLYEYVYSSKFQFMA
ncbi:hypothetical protein H0H93_016361 [Arthromyces matolae]|nr:hypothetical protein H0H93_016361 [Arthromyces matolae]